MRIWKFVLFIIILSIVVAPLVSVSEAIIPLALVTVLIYFPGDGEKPRLIRWLPYIWGLSFIESLIIVIDNVSGAKIFPPEIYAIIKMNETMLTLAFAPVMIWAFYKKQDLFKWLFYANMVLSMILSFYNFAVDEQTVKNWIDLIASISTDIILIIYFQKKLFKAA